MTRTSTIQYELLLVLVNEYSPQNDPADILVSHYEYSCANPMRMGMRESGISFKWGSATHCVGARTGDGGTATKNKGLSV